MSGMIPNYDLNTVAVNYVAQYGIFFSFLIIFCFALMTMICCIGKSFLMNPRLNLKRSIDETCIFKVIPYESLYENEKTNLITELKKLNNGDESFIIEKKQLNSIVVQSYKNNITHSLQISDLSGIVIPDDENISHVRKNDSMPLVKTDIHNNQKKIYLCYVFDNMNTDESQVFEDLVIFVNIVLKTMNHEMVEIIFKIHSPGGSADTFQNAFLQLKRLRDRNFVLTALVDNMCASGGYMLAAACNTIICSEFAEIGSIGVAATLHNYHTLSQKLGVIEKTITTGLYKRPFLPGEPLEQDHIDRVGESVNESLNIFKNIVQNSRNFSEEQMIHILSAKTWNGKQALDLGLVDLILCSDDYLVQLCDANNQVYMIKRLEIENESKINELLSLVTKNIFTKVVNSVVKSIIKSIALHFGGKTKKNTKLNL